MPDLPVQVSTFDHHGHKRIDIPHPSSTVVKLTKMPVSKLGQSSESSVDTSKVGPKKRQITSNIKQLYTFPKPKESKQLRRDIDKETTNIQCQPTLQTCSPEGSVESQVQANMSTSNTTEELSEQTECRTKAKLLAKLRSNNMGSDDSSSNASTASTSATTSRSLHKMQTANGNASSHVASGIGGKYLQPSKGYVGEVKEAKCKSVSKANAITKKKPRFRKAKLPVRSPETEGPPTKLFKRDKEQPIKLEARDIQKAYRREQTGEMKSSNGNRVGVAASKAYQDFVSGLYEPNVQKHNEQQKKETSSTSKCETPDKIKKTGPSSKLQANSDRNLRTQKERKLKSFGPDMYYIDDGDVIRRGLMLGSKNSDAGSSKSKKELQMEPNCDRVKRNLKKSFDNLCYGSESKLEISKQRKSPGTKSFSKISARKNTSAYQMKTARVVLEKLDVERWKNESVQKLTFTPTTVKGMVKKSYGNAIIGVISKGLDSSSTAEDGSNEDGNISKDELSFCDIEAHSSSKKPAGKTSFQAANAGQLHDSVVNKEALGINKRQKNTNDNLELQRNKNSPEFACFIAEKYKTSTPKDKSVEKMFHNRTNKYAEKVVSEINESPEVDERYLNPELKEPDKSPNQIEKEGHYTTPDTSNGMNVLDSNERQLHLELEETPDILSSIPMNQGQGATVIETQYMPVKESTRIHPLMDMESQSDSEISNQTADGSLENTVPDRPSSVSLDKTDIKKRPVSTYINVI